MLPFYQAVHQGTKTIPSGHLHNRLTALGTDETYGITVGMDHAFIYKRYKALDLSQMLVNVHFDLAIGADCFLSKIEDDFYFDLLLGGNLS